MSNELLLIISLIISYGMAFVFYKLMGRTGLYVWTAIATIIANIEVAVLIDAYGMEQTLGNVLFASTFLVTDIISENYDKKSANKAVMVGIMANLSFIILSRLWFLFTPNSKDYIMPHMEMVFKNTPRFMIVGITVYAIAQVFDVWMYHFVWKQTTKFFGESKKGLFIRNNLSTLCSQLINTFLFTVGAFYGSLDTEIMISIGISSYIIYIVTSILDTPFVYLARKFPYKGDK